MQHESSTPAETQYHCTICACWWGAEVTAATDGGVLEGTLLSCTTRSAWIVVDDVDHVVALARLRSIYRQ